MRELIQNKPKVIIGITAIALALLACAAVKLAQPKAEAAHVQTAEQNSKSAQIQVPTPSQTVSVVDNDTTKTTSKNAPQVSAAAPAQPMGDTNQSTGSELVIIPQENSPQPETGVINGQTLYDASGNSCGMGPTGICVMPFAGRTIEVRSLGGKLIATTTSDSTGRFTLKLTPGKYKLIPGQGSGVNPSANIQEVTVPNGNTVEATVLYWAIATTNTVSL